MSLSLFASLWRRSPKLPIVPVPTQSTAALYYRKAPWWARWALVLVALDVMAATSAMEITWNHWTVPSPTNSAREESTNDTADEVILQPLWKRGPACMLHFMSGCVVAGSILAFRSRVVRSVSIVQTSKAANTAPRVYVQTASHPPNFGHEFPLRWCLLKKRSDAQLIFDVQNQGRWLLDMRGASINGRPPSAAPEVARTSMLGAWKSQLLPSVSKPTVIPTQINKKSTGRR
ncbi:hypothetical protein B0H34DRAFT_715723 [Crassisporium funariophilum]|nr:hypothetical protein B0H34DRAFT_715723 [Crassisporium funariophilum]